MRADKLAYYLFISEASSHVENLDISLDNLLNSRVYRTARIREIEGAKEVLEGEIRKMPIPASSVPTT
jgi:DNA primase large subunit